MDEVDYSKIKGIADEKHFDEFIPLVGGERVDPLITRQGVKKADYLFREAKVVCELKVLETEFGQTPEAEAKADLIFEKYKDDKSDEGHRRMMVELNGILKAPLQRIVRKANTQIKETKQELNLVGYEGVLICVNDNFRGATPAHVIGTLAQIMSGQSYRSIRAVVYLTNHYVEIPDHPDALLLWQPMYSDLASENLPRFINVLGRAWGDFTESQTGPFTSRTEHERIDLTPATVVTGLRRNVQYRGPSF
ncbi:hypothetical protein [Rhizobium lentis]|uniref:hypothetical protein n=1 Tax=Rhizobium lentis TaxID=1138194 RepID=UPI001C83D083|nr:hypothetical protein [Rhizobium lentis]MBX5144952.1 hypothetical protein [Rhizobium lentis]